MAEDETAPLLSSEESANPIQSPSLISRIRAGLESPKKLNGLEKLLLALSLLFLLLTATFVGLFAGEAVKNRREHRHHENPPPRHSQTAIPLPTSTVTTTSTVTNPTGTPQPVPKLPERNNQICLTPTCVKAAATILESLDTNIDPCEDFYQFSNGNWLATHPIPDGAGLFGSAQDIGVRNKRIILEILDSKPSKDLAEADQTNLNHLRQFWFSCLDEDLIDRQGLQPMLDLVQTIIDAWRGLPSKPPTFVDQSTEIIENVVDSLSHHKKKKNRHSSPEYDPETKRDRLTTTLMFMHSRAIGTLFETYPEGDVRVDPKQIVLWLRQAGLGLPSKDYYKDKEILSVYQEIIRASLKSIYTARQETKHDFNKLAEQVLKFEKKLAKISQNPDALEDPALTYNSRNSTELQNLFPSISFKNYFASFTPRPTYPNPVIVTFPQYLEDLHKLLEEADSVTLEAYFVFRAALSYGTQLGPKQTVRKEIDWLHNYLGGVAEGTRAPRGEICLNSLQENFGFLIGRYYVQKAFAGDSKSYAEEIIEATIQAFKDRLPELSWLDADTRRVAEEKADAITHKIGYPTNPNTTDPQALANYYSINLPITKTDYFGNVLRSRLADQRRNWVQIGHERDSGRWEMIPSEVNAYYSPPGNEIAFPAGILQSPYFSKDWPEYFVFGSFGSVAGHELSHGFDQSGRLYDKTGKLTDWWSNQTVTKFESLQQCFLDQYSNYSVSDAKGSKYYINAKFTNGEDMADAGGLAQSFRAWTDRFESDPNGKQFDNYLLPGLNFTRQQLFFIAYAQGWARNIYPEEAVKRIRTDPHSPTNYRVIGPLSNDEEFSKAFNCKAGQPMSNKNKCKVW